MNSSRQLRGFGPAALVIAVLALVIAAGGASYAAGLAKNSVGTTQLKSGAVTSAKVKDKSLLAKDFKPGQLPAGATGASGPAGAPGAPGANGTASGWAWIAADGTVTRSGGQSPITNADITHTASSGVYAITASGWKAGFISTPFSAALIGTGPGEITASPGFVNIFSGITTQTRVFTFSSAGAAADHAFFVLLP